jgi:hypothetical protein
MRIDGHPRKDALGSGEIIHNGDPMSEMKRNELMMELLAELAPEIEAAHSTPQDIFPAKTGPMRPSLSQVLADYIPLPREALFLGVAADQLPVLLNLLDPVPGPILIAGDQASGKTAFLQMIARSVDQIHLAQSVQYGVITEYPQEWSGLGGTPNCVDIFPAFKNGAQDFLNSLANWTHSNRGDKQSVLLLIDDLASISRMDFDARQNLRWLLLRGPARRVWPIATLNPNKAAEVFPWTDFFHTRLFGRMENSAGIENLTGTTNPIFKSLNAGSDFLMREGEDWLKFWTPALD